MRNLAAKHGENRGILKGTGIAENNSTTRGLTMHELSIAESILEILNRSVPSGELDQVRTVHMKVGTMAGVVCESLEFSFKALTSGTPLAGAELSIDRVPFRIHCSSCDATSPSRYGLSTCPRCSGTDTRVVSGMELQVVSIDLCESVPETS